MRHYSCYVLSPFASLPGHQPDSSQVAKLTKEQQKAYFKEYDYRVKLLQKKQWRERGHTLVPRWIVHVALKLPTMHLTNGVILKFNERTILQNLCKNNDYFLHFKKIGTNVQNDYKDKDQNAYSLKRKT